jgi:hypothetical protein
MWNLVEKIIATLAKHSPYQKLIMPDQPADNRQTASEIQKTMSPVEPQKYLNVSAVQNGWLVGTGEHVFGVQNPPLVYTQPEEVASAVFGLITRGLPGHGKLVTLSDADKLYAEGYRNGKASVPPSGLTVAEENKLKSDRDRAESSVKVLEKEVAALRVQVGIVPDPKLKAQLDALNAELSEVKTDRDLYKFRFGPVSEDLTKALREGKHYLEQVIRLQQEVRDERTISANLRQDLDLIRKQENLEITHLKVKVEQRTKDLLAANENLAKLEKANNERTFGSDYQQGRDDASAGHRTIVNRLNREIEVLKSALTNACGKVDKFDARLKSEYHKAHAEGYEKGRQVQAPVSFADGVKAGRYANDLLKAQDMKAAHAEGYAEGAKAGNHEAMEWKGHYERLCGDWGKGYQAGRKRASDDLQKVQDMKDAERLALFSAQNLPTPPANADIQEEPQYKSPLVLAARLPGEPDCGFAIGDSWVSMDGTRRTITQVSDAIVVYTRQPLKRPGNTCRYYRNRACREWAKRVGPSAIMFRSGVNNSFTFRETTPRIHPAWKTATYDYVAKVGDRWTSGDGKNIVRTVLEVFPDGSVTYEHSSGGAFKLSARYFARVLLSSNSRRS